MGVVVADERPTPATSFAPVTVATVRGAAAIPGAWPIDAEALRDLLSAETVIIDVRPAERRGAGFIDGSVSLPLSEIRAETLLMVVAEKTRPLIFYGAGDGRAGDAARMALAHGYISVYWFRGGWREWLGKEMMVAFGAPKEITE